MQDLPKKGDTVVVGLSGGVDSTLTALLLKEKGCHVIGVTMSLWDGKLPELSEADLSGGKKLHDSCYGPGEIEDIEQCEKFCSEQGIEYHVIDVKDDYRKEVLEYFKEEYRSGRTPNPCIRCNRYIKFGALLSGIKKLDIAYDYFCTGHYAKLVRPDEGLYGTDNRPCMIQTALDMSKDQTYFVSRVPSSVLEKVRFPLAQMTKAQVFERAREYGLAAAEREESQDFVPPEYFELLFSDKPSIPGDIIDLDGHVLGKHRGIEHYTVGQRRGLGVSSSKPLYVHSIDAVNNLVVLASNDDLNASGLIASDFVWPGDVEPFSRSAGSVQGVDIPAANASTNDPPRVQYSLRTLVKIRLASKPTWATISPCTDENCYEIKFDMPQRAIAPGQSAVLYDENGVILGSGIIVRSVK